MLVWKKGSRSNGSSGNNCVEVARQGDSYFIRDSKHPEVAPLQFTKAEWDAFMAGAQAGEFRDL